MLFVLICSYIGVWSCAYAAAHAWPGRMGFWAFYGVAIAVVPLVSAFVLEWIFSAANPEYGAMITDRVVLFGVVLALIAYPIKYLREKVEE